MTNQQFAGMLLRNVELKYFRSFNSLSVPLDPRMNLFIGGNGAGKTTLLDAIALALAPIITRLPKPERASKPPTLRVSDIHIEKDDHTSPYAFLGAASRSTPASPEILHWDRYKLRDNSPRTKGLLPVERQDMKQLHSYVDRLTDAHNAEAPFTLPVFAYYGTNRAINVPHNKPRERTSPKNFKRALGLDGALDAQTDFRRAVSWFNLLDQREARIQREENHKRCLPELDAVRRAIELTVNDIKRPRIDEHTGRFVVDAPSGDNGAMVKLELDQLSDGYQVMLGVVMDFALRLALANPSTAQQPDPLQSEAILIIDEVDLHLHPEWQQRVVTDLAKAFPNTQLILTTHSPQVVTTVDSSHIRILHERKLEPAPAGLLGAESVRALKRAFDTPARPPAPDAYNEPDHPENLLNRYFDMIAEDKWDTPDALALRAKLDHHFQGEEPELERADVLIANRRFDRESPR